MKKIFVIILMSMCTLNTLFAANSQDDVKAAIIGKLGHFIKWKKNSTNQNFVITVLRDETFKKLLDEKYLNKNMHSKNVEIRYAQEIDDIKTPEMLYVNNLSQKEQFFLSQYAKKNSILTLSEEKGFAQRGGIIQFYFVSQKIKLKINREVSLNTGLKISSSLLAISTIVKGEK